MVACPNPAMAALSVAYHGTHPGVPGAQSGWGVREADLMPEIAASSSLSEVSPETPTQPTTAPVASLTRTPPGTGTSLPPIAAAAEVMKYGCCSARAIRDREPMPSAR